MSCWFLFRYVSWLAGCSICSLPVWWLSFVFSVCVYVFVYECMCGCACAWVKNVCMCRGGKKIVRGTEREFCVFNHMKCGFVCILSRCIRDIESLFCFGFCMYTCMIVSNKDWFDFCLYRCPSSSQFSSCWPESQSPHHFLGEQLCGQSTTSLCPSSSFSLLSILPPSQ